MTQHFMRGEFAEGTRLLGEKEADLPKAVRLECLGNMHFYRRELQEAVRCYEEAITIAPENIISRYQYLVGTQDEREGRLTEAFKRYQAAIEAEPAFVDPYVELGGMLVKVQDFEGAAQCYRDAVRLDPADVANHFNLKAVLTRLAQREPERYREELAKAEAAYEQAAKQHGTSKQLSRHQW
jgi:tetratricopeptide (TPR) repeat protein